MQALTTFYLRRHRSQAIAVVPGTDEIAFAVLVFPRRGIEKLIDESRRGFNNSYGKLRLLHAIEGRREGAHVGDFTGHQELQGLPRTLVLSEADETLVNDLRASLSGNVTSQINSQIPSDFQIICRPGISHRIEQPNTTAAGDGYQRIGLSGFAAALHGLQVHAYQRSHDFQ